MITGIDIYIWSKDFNQSINFYRILGFNLHVNIQNLDFYNVQMLSDDCHIKLFFSKDESLYREKSPISISVDDLDCIIRALAAAGFNILERREAPYASFAFVKDPSNQIISVIEYYTSKKG